MDGEREWVADSDREEDPYPERFGLLNHGRLIPSRNRRYSHFSLDQNEDQSEFIESEDESDRMDNHGSLEPTKLDQHPISFVNEGIRHEPDQKVKLDRDEGHPSMENSNSCLTGLLPSLGPRLMAVKYQGSTVIRTPVNSSNRHKFLVLRESASLVTLELKATVTLSNLRMSSNQRARAARALGQAQMKQLERERAQQQDKTEAEQLDDQRSTDMPTQTAQKPSGTKKMLLKQLQASPSSDDSIMVTDPCELQTGSRRQTESKVPFQHQERYGNKFGGKLASGKGSKRMQPARPGDKTTFLGKRMAGGSDSTQSAPASTTDVAAVGHQAAVVAPNISQMRVIDTQASAKVVESYRRNNLLVRKVEVPGPEARFDEAWKHLWKNHQDRKLKSKLDDLVAYWSQGIDRQTPILFKSLSKEVSNTGVKVTKTVDLSNRKLSMSVATGKHLPPSAIQKEAAIATQFKNAAKPKRKQPPVLQPPPKHTVEHHTSGFLAGFVKIAPGPFRPEMPAPRREQQELYHLRNITAEPEETEI